MKKSGETFPGHQSESGVFIGTSGWTYDHWLGRFYPENLPRKRWFEYYCEHYRTVELNASFYRIPTIKAVEGWERRSPPDFVFSIKISRLITHVHKLHNCEREIDWFFTNFAPLRPKIGVYLAQLPPTLKCNPELIANFSRLLPKEAWPMAFEFRNASWYNEEVYSALRELGFSFCIHDMAGHQTDRIVTAEPVYLRFHGYGSRYGGNYPGAVLLDWAKWIKAASRKHGRVFGFFNNDINACAVKNSRTLKAMTGSVLPSVKVMAEPG